MDLAVRGWLRRGRQAEFDVDDPSYVPVEELRAEGDPRWAALLRGELYSSGVDPVAFRQEGFHVAQVFANAHQIGLAAHDKAVEAGRRAGIGRPDRLVRQVLQRAADALHGWIFCIAGHEQRRSVRSRGGCAHRRHHRWLPAVLAEGRLAPQDGRPMQAVEPQRMQGHASEDHATPTQVTASNSPMPAPRHPLRRSLT